MTRRERLLQNPRWLFIARFLGNVKMLNAIVTLFYLHRGLGIDQVMFLSAVYGVASMVVEVPTGYMADRFGRRTTLQIGFLALGLAMFMQWFASGFFEFALAFVVMAFAASCFSGTEEACLYDTLKELGKEGEMTRRWGRLLSAQNLPKIFFPPLGAFIAQGLLEWQFGLLIAADIVAAVIAVGVLFFVVEPKHERDVEAEEEGILRESVATIRARPELLRASLNKVIPFVASLLLWRVSQSYLFDLGASVAMLGVFYIFTHGLVFSLRWFSDAVERRFGDARVLNATALFAGVTALLSSFGGPAIIPAVFFVLFFAALALREPMYSHWMNRQIRSRSRATTLSNLTVFRSFFDIPIMILGGWLAVMDQRYALVFTGVICLAVWVFLRIPREKHQISSTKH